MIGINAERGRIPIDVDKSPSHRLSHSEIASDNPCSQHLSELIEDAKRWGLAAKKQYYRYALLWLTRALT